ncbi:Proline--tRNA ligase,prolyl-tRNA synthetase,Prolyl-tRNA synthetase,proline--tRNA ligase,tRNA synthetase class II core domain (G, H, P, S and T) [Chlamydia serpentis]|uniref:Proline--tRNA ligase n=1 Tax=Chlamydia serpentis TaxID=1967782 RepID=A0A2R8FB04_9CHLA|nr:proline--tRNA ligase [Chlamydia serpentis]SPN73620.1 Proline--tRNA ligase,prolyl-tRNA synthetase,Prolyl-tRNA synthetase,proline--tRNA ligase,tRNA synthetase class II core domain (G, H, P, S and T) [Chlamydia serpentis]
MKTSQLFYKTSKNANKNAPVLSNELLEKAGYLFKVGKGIYTYTPLLWRVILKMMTIIREELNAIGGQELILPLLQSAELWEHTGRWQAFTSEGLLYTLIDREEKSHCLAPTHEEMICSFVTQWLSAKKQLPLHLYQIATKFRDEIRPRFGLIRSRELLMEDSYTFSDSPEQMNEQYEKLRLAYSKIFDRFELTYVIVEADGGKIGKGKSEEFQVLCSLGEDTICVSGSYGANIEAAVAIPPQHTYDRDFLPIEEVATPGISTIESLGSFFSIPLYKILKTLVVKLTYSDQEKFIAIGIRGDRQVNLVKVASKLNADNAILASDEEIERALHTEKGFIGPLNCPIDFFSDETTVPMTNFVCAGNVKDKHYVNVNWDRDLPRPEYADFLLVEAGDTCPENPATPYQIYQGIEVAHIFNLGTRYTQSFDITFQDEEGETQFCWMGTYGIGLGRTLAACVEQLADDRGIVWPKALAPFSITIAFNGGDAVSQKLGEKLYNDLKAEGYEPLLDDRDERLGFKLKDSDLIGIPYKLILGKSYQSSGMFEIESRSGEKYVVSPETFLAWCQSYLV